MPWPLKKITVEKGLDIATGARPKPGDWWFEPWFLEETAENLKDWGVVSDQYLRESYPLKRAPVIIMLPGGMEWMMDSNSTSGSGWNISGEEGKWTASPSILVNTTNRSGYHGFLRDGVLTDDCEGKKF